jgi:hypothetical protein
LLGRGFEPGWSGCTVRVPSPTGDSTQVVGMRGRGQGSVVAAVARSSRGGEITAAAAVELRALPAPLGSRKQIYSFASLFLKG